MCRDQKGRAFVPVDAIDQAPDLIGGGPVEVGGGSSGLTTELGVAEFDRRGGAWKPIREAPRGTESIQLGVKADGAISALSFPCRWSSIAWVDALSGKTLHVRPTHWREWPSAVSDE